MNLTAYAIATPDDKPLFTRNCANRAQAYREIVNNPYLSLVDYVIFKRVRYPIGEVYTWGKVVACTY